jgi:hypothetical protein
VRLLLPLLSLIVAATFIALGAARAQTPTPAPTPTPTPTVFPPPAPLIPPPGSGSICVSQYDGGQTVTPVLPVRALFQITLPPGGHYSVNGGIADPGGEFVRVCYVEGNSAIFFNPEGRETSRVVNNPSANRVLDEIARGVNVSAPPSPPQTISPPMNNICGSAARNISGGESIRFSSPQGTIIITLIITLPTPGDYQFSIPGEIPGSGNGISICDTATNSTLLINTATGKELGRIISGQSGGLALDRILAGVQLLSTNAEEPSQRALRPPITGDGGLR